MAVETACGRISCGGSIPSVLPDPELAREHHLRQPLEGQTEHRPLVHEPVHPSESSLDDGAAHQRVLHHDDVVVAVPDAVIASARVHARGHFACARVCLHCTR